MTARTWTGPSRILRRRSSKPRGRRCDDGCDVKKEKPDYLECTRSRHVGVMVGSGGEKVTVQLTDNGAETRVQIKMGKGFVGWLGKNPGVDPDLRRHDDDAHWLIAMRNKPVFVFLLAARPSWRPRPALPRRRSPSYRSRTTRSRRNRNPVRCESSLRGSRTVPFVDLGFVNYHDERHRAKDGSLKLELAMPKIKARACRAGADALIDIRVTEVRRLEFTMFNVRAVAIRFAPE